MNFELPLCIIPEEITTNYLEKVKKFYRDKKEKQILQLTEEINREKNLEIKLTWDSKIGLKNISLLGGGIDLTENHHRYQFHNIYHESEEGKILFKIAKEYLSLLK